MSLPDTSYNFGLLARKRLKLVGAGLATMFIGLSFRLCWVSLKPLSCIKASITSPLRAEIIDRHGRVLASSVTTFSVYAHPERIMRKKEAALALHRLFPDLSLEKLTKALSSAKSFVWITRHITPEKKLAVQALGIEGVEIKKDSKRIYPHGSLFCHVVGLTDIDQQGISGLEKFFQERLSQESTPLRTSLDLRLQHLVYGALSEQMKDFQAEAGNAILADIQTGEILAMVSLPDFSPAEGVTGLDKALFNRNLSGVYEFGSIMKIHNVALLLESGKGTLDSIFDASCPLRIGKFRVTDFKGKNRPLTVEEAFLYSSNIAHAKMAQLVGGAAQIAFFKKLGLMSPLKVELPESAHPLMPAKWSEACTLTAGYGYGFAITPLHVVQSVSALVSGYRKPLTLVAMPRKAPAQSPVVSAHTAKIIAQLMAKAVLQGQAKKAKASNCIVGAKTGTANLRLSGKYCQKENLTSCVSIFPADKPQYVLLVSIERAKPNAKSYYYATAGWIAAPVVSHIVEQVAPLLGVLHFPQESNTTLVEHLVDRAIQERF